MKECLLSFTETNNPPSPYLSEEYQWCDPSNFAWRGIAASPPGHVSLGARIQPSWCGSGCAPAVETAQSLAHLCESLPASKHSQKNKFRSCNLCAKFQFSMDKGVQKFSSAWTRRIYDLRENTMCSDIMKHHFSAALGARETQMHPHPHKPTLAQH